jgi:hypothetical protein
MAKPDKNKSLRAFCAQVTTAMDTLISNQDAAGAAKFAALRDSFNAALAAYPEEKADAAAGAAAPDPGAELLFACLTQSQDLIAGLTTSLNEVRKSLAEKVTALNALETRVSTGDLVPKLMVTELCSAAGKTASAAAATETETRVRAEFANRDQTAKTINDRKAALQTAGLPFPVEAVLAGTDAEFTAAQTEAVKRIEPYKKALAPNSTILAKLAWCAATELKDWEGIVKEAVSTTKVAFEPLAGGTTSGNSSGGTVVKGAV